MTSDNNHLLPPSGFVSMYDLSLTPPAESLLSCIADDLEATTLTVDQLVTAKGDYWDFDHPALIQSAIDALMTKHHGAAGIQVYAKPFKTS